MKLGRLLLSVAVLSAACTRQGPNVIEIKVLALTPDEYVGKRVHVRGRMSDPGPGWAYFTLTDDSGSVLATTEPMGSPLPCEKGDSMLAEGTVRNADSAGRTYISIEHITECRKVREVVHNP